MSNHPIAKPSHPAAIGAMLAWLAAVLIATTAPALADTPTIPATPPRSDRAWTQPVRYGDLVHVAVADPQTGNSKYTRTLDEAKSQCGEVIDGVTGWRLPTRDEALADGRVPLNGRSSWRTMWDQAWLSNGRSVNGAGESDYGYAGSGAVTICVHAPYASSIPTAQRDQRGVRIAQNHRPDLFPTLLFVICIGFELADSAQELRGLIRYWEQSGFTADELLLDSRCHEANYLPSTLVPAFHMVAENATDRLPIFDGLRLYLVEDKQRPDLWQAVVNARSSGGMTPLDYMEYILANKRAIPAEAPGIAKFIDFMCANGATYAYYQKRCTPAPTSPSDIEQRIRR